MKLVIKEYLASLREREELDAILPDLLSQMGLNVFILPSRGVKEYGVDIAAVGSLDGESEKVFLFSVKSGNLTRETWDGTSPQSLRPSLNQILDSFIPNRIPSKHREKPVEICLCFGGDVNSGIRQEVSGYTASETKENISFCEWNGDKLAEYIERYFLRENIAPESIRSQLRKSLAMIDQPSIAFKHFGLLVDSICNGDFKRQKDNVTALRQLLIYTWVLYSWCREENNIECAYLSIERVALAGWDLVKPFFGKKTKVAKDCFGAYDSLISLYNEISKNYFGKVVIPHSSSLYALSRSASSSCSVDANLKLFDLAGRVALFGIWSYWEFSLIENPSEEALSAFRNVFNTVNEALIKTINNNPTLFSPYKDDQAIDIAICIFFLSLDEKNFKNIEGWIGRILQSSYRSIEGHRTYPSNLEKYSDLIEHPRVKTEEYRKSVTQGSILYPYLSFFSAIFNFDNLYSGLARLKNDFFEHSNFQMYFFDESSEDKLYANTDLHGATLSHVPVDKEADVFYSEIKSECEKSSSFNNLSAMQYGVWPLVILACRHHRLPVPAHFYIAFKKIEK